MWVCMHAQVRYRVVPRTTLDDLRLARLPAALSSARGVWGVARLSPLPRVRPPRPQLPSLGGDCLLWQALALYLLLAAVAWRRDQATCMHARNLYYMCMHAYICAHAGGYADVLCKKAWGRSVCPPCLPLTGRGQ